MIVYISYSSVDYDLVQPLAVQLGLLGHDVLFEQKSPGADVGWFEVFESIRGCDLFVYALTRCSRDSRSGQVEYRYAHALHKRILPVILDNVNIYDLPTELNRIPAVDHRAPGESNRQLERAIAMLPLPYPPPEYRPLQPELRSSLEAFSAELAALPPDGDRQWGVFRNLTEFLERQETYHDAADLLHGLQQHPLALPEVRQAVGDVFRDTHASVRQHKRTNRLGRLARDVLFFLAGVAFLFVVLRGSIFMRTALGDTQGAVVEDCPDMTVQAVPEGDTTGAVGSLRLTPPTTSPLALAPTTGLTPSGTDPDGR